MVQLIDRETKSPLDQARHRIAARFGELQVNVLGSDANDGLLVGEDLLVALRFRCTVHPNKHSCEKEKKQRAHVTSDLTFQQSNASECACALQKRRTSLAVTDDPRVPQSDRRGKEVARVRRRSRSVATNHVEQHFVPLTRDGLLLELLVRDGLLAGAFFEMLQLFVSKASAPTVKCASCTCRFCVFFSRKVSATATATSVRATRRRILTVSALA